ncbi:methyltransferase domain-containing protein [Indioceanicola profundi]|uniref:methyltransferase domain-containing protein n=1 Tax=Indioceanicola profundi TaxID=2220096 RepID=UPI00196932F8|nr:methyltransferase domain-containing protein [Indioceanicola profundi]
MSVLAGRSRALELMDTEQVPYPEFQDCLRQLERINRASLGYRPTLRWLDRLVERRGAAAPLTILDVGFGHGDMLRRVAGWAGARGVPVRLVGVDLSPWSARSAQAATPPDMPIAYHVGDVFEWRQDEPVDVVLSALFTHHLPDAELVRFLRWMRERARAGWFINDLHRHPIPYGFVGAAARLLPVNRLVRHDAPLSVARSFTRADWDRLIRRAELEGVTVEWHFPFRWGVGWMAG